jgi:hypothetical protein
VQRNLKRAGQVITPAAVNIIRLHLDVDIKVSIWPTGKTNFTLPSQLQSEPIFNATRNVQIQVATGSDPALSPTVDAWIRNYLTVTTTGVTRLAGNYVAQKRSNFTLHRARTTTNVTHLSRGSGTTGSAVTSGAEHCRVNLDGLLNTENHFTQGQFDSKQCVLATLGARSWATLAPATEEGVKDVAETKVSTRETSPETALTTHVIVATLVIIGENLIGVGNQFESLLSILGRIYVRVQLSGQLAISLLDLIAGCVLRDSQNLIVISQNLFLAL